MEQMIKDHPEYNFERTPMATPSESKVKANSAVITPATPTGVAPGPCPKCHDDKDLHWAKECTATSCKLCFLKFADAEARNKHRGRCPKATISGPAKQRDRTTKRPRDRDRNRDRDRSHPEKRVKANQAVLEQLDSLQKAVAALSAKKDN
jgi:hypothetical protein